MNDERTKRFFVTIIAPDSERLREVMTFDLDLFAARSDEAGYRTDGLVALEDVARLVEAGYRVLVAGTDRPAQRLRPIGFTEWRKQILADLEADQKEE
jgi:hypothetical protein